VAERLAHCSLPLLSTLPPRGIPARHEFTWVDSRPCTALCTSAVDSNVTDIFDVSVVRADGGMLKRVTDPAFLAAVPSWSHDGLWIYCASDRIGRFEILEVANGRTLLLPAVGGDRVALKLIVHFP
jgi:hypothetical protein